MIGTRGLPATYGGVERAVEELSARLAAEGHEVTVYCRTTYCPTRTLSHRGIRLRYLPCLNTKHLEAISHSLLATLDALVRRYDIVHYHALGPGLCAPLARIGGLRVVTTVHALDFRRDKWGSFASRVLRLGALVAARVPKRTIVVSRQLADYFAAEYGCRAVVVPNGVEVRTHDRRTEGSGTSVGRHFLFLGRLVPEKGVHTLIAAYRELDTEVPLVIAGPSSHSDDYERQLRELARDDPRISFAGAVYGDDKAALTRDAYAFCQPSTVEGLPIVLLEMMSEAVCPIVSDIPEHLEVVAVNGAAPTAVVFGVGDARSLREALAITLAHPELVAELGASARANVAERYSWTDIASAVSSIYAEVSAT